MSETQTAPAQTTATFERTVRPHMAAMSKRALRLTGNESDAADLVQDALVRAFRFFHTFTPGTGAAQWLYTVVRNTHYNRCEAAKSRRNTADAHRADTEAMGSANVPSPADAAEASETVSRVRAALESLPAQFADAVRMVDLEGMSTTEAAEAMGCKPGTVNSRAMRGRAKLRAALEAAA